MCIHFIFACFEMLMITFLNHLEHYSVLNLPPFAFLNNFHKLI